MKWLKNLFKKKKDKQIEELEEALEEKEETPREFPDEIEVPWKKSAPVLNTVRLIAKTEAEFGTFLFQTKKREKVILDSLDQLDEQVQEKINKLREEYDIPIELEEAEYDFLLPDATGKSGKFVKLKSDEQ
tara:strand:+ start:498 stop:890 length:393 start_codon:yes stop_codon:yes gene_type:complete